MELCKGGDYYGNYVEKGELLPEKDAAIAFADVFRAIVHCHAQNIIHRDIKPDNIMIGDEGKVKLVDFGFAM